jgi:hypothetical protein
MEFSEASAGVSLYVSPLGNDGNGGTKDKPLGTLDGARRRVRELRAEAGGEISVFFRGGEYFLGETAVFSPEDSGREGAPVRYRAFPGETPVFTSGKRLSGWRPAGDPEKPGLLAADLPGVRTTRQFYVNGRLAARTRMPLDKSAFRLAGEPRAVTANGKQLQAYPGYRTTALYADLKRWRNPSALEFVYDISWVHRVIPVESVAECGDGLFIAMQWEPFRTCQIGSLTKVDLPDSLENAYELLRNPGEWYFDPALHRMYYLPLPGEDMDSADAVVPFTEQLVRMEGTPDRKVSHISFEGLSFRYSTWIYPSLHGWPEQQANFALDPGRLENTHACSMKPPAAVTLRMADGISFSDCGFSKLGAGAVTLEEGTRNCRIERCVFRDVAGSGVMVGGVELKDAHPFTEGTIEHHRHDERLLVKDNTVSNCCLDGIGTDCKGSVGILVGYAEHTVVSHNSVSNIAYTGISVGWGWGYWDRGGRDAPDYPKIALDDPTTARGSVIEYNDIHHVMMKLHDGGGIYTLSDMPGTVIRGNLVHDITGWPGGIYLDEGSGGMKVSENITWNTQMSHFINVRTDTYGYRKDPPVLEENFWGILPGEATFPSGKAARAGLEPENRRLLTKQIESLAAPDFVRAGDTAVLTGCFGKNRGGVVLKGESGNIVLGPDCRTLFWSDAKLAFPVPEGTVSGPVTVLCADGTKLTSSEFLSCGGFGKVLWREDFGGFPLGAVKETDAAGKFDEFPSECGTAEEDGRRILKIRCRGECRILKKTDRRDCALCFDFRFDRLPSGRGGIYAAPYTSGAHGLPAYFAEFLPRLGRSIHMEQLIDRKIRGTGTADFRFEAGIWYSAVIACADDVLHAKVWERGSAEPALWNARGKFGGIGEGGVLIRLESLPEEETDCSLADLRLLEYVPRTAGKGK